MLFLLLLVNSQLSLIRDDGELRGVQRESLELETCVCLCVFSYFSNLPRSLIEEGEGLDSGVNNTHTNLEGPLSSTPPADIRVK